MNVAAFLCLEENSIPNSHLQHDVLLGISLRPGIPEQQQMLSSFRQAREALIGLEVEIPLEPKEELVVGLFKRSCSFAW